uniref:Peroxisomal membrane protein 2 n=1 Tax=Chelonoidis abingdonii TaxID=106734 RepID=A0A8C0H1R3_CHEAB
MGPCRAGMRCVAGAGDACPAAAQAVPALLIMVGRGLAVLSALGSLLSQVIERSRKKPGSSKSLDLSEPLRFAIYGFLFTGPLSHYFYLYLEQLIPSNVPFAMVKRLLLDRLVVAPPFLLLFFFIMNLLEGKDLSAFAEKIKSGYWVALKMNWKVWTPVQFVNVNYVPMQFRVLFGNLVALFWFAYLASIKKR